MVGYNLFMNGKKKVVLLYKTDILTLIPEKIIEWVTKKSISKHR